MLDSNQFVGREDLMAAAGVDSKNLGFVGLKLSAVPFHSFLDNAFKREQLLVSDFVYAPENDYRTWVSGPVGILTPHVTAKYGLIKPSYSQKEIIDALIGDVVGESVVVSRLDVFPSYYEDLEYGCLVARIDSDLVRNMNAALSVLPHVDSFVEFKPHVTIAYLKPLVAESLAYGDISQLLVGEEIEITGIDYGEK